MIVRAPRRAAKPAQVIPAAGTLLWADEFNGAAGDLLSTADWNYDVGRFGAGAGEQQYYTNATAANCAKDGLGNLKIVARNEVPPDAAASPMDFTSARVHTKDKHAWAPAPGAPVRLVSRMTVPRTKGLLPAFWTIGSGVGSWPAVGEIDVMELPAHAGDNLVAMNIHGPTNGSPTVDKTIGAATYYDPQPLSARFHEIGVDWYTDRIVWHFDGRVIGQITQAQYVAASGDWTPLGGSLTHFVILNIAVGNDWTGDPDGTSVWPQTMLVDWVRAYAIT